jgi:ubiquinone/menaquinone biosynthesis C-methylase UbiE
METEQEFDRLERQARMTHYRLEDELRGVVLYPRMKILDAGCGSGVASRFLADRFLGVNIEACDLSDIRLQQARNASRHSGLDRIRFFRSSVEEIQTENDRYDFVFCRFVLEHLPNPVRAISEFFRVLKPGGMLFLVDLDGILFNLTHQDPVLAQQLDSIRQGLSQDLFVGRRLPQLVHRSGFIGLNWKVSVMDFQGADLSDELELTQDRLAFALPLFSKILGSDDAAQDFRRRYCEEILKPGSTLFYNKFVVSGVKG